MTHRVLHLLSQRPGWTGSGVSLDAIVRAAATAGWQQHAVVGTAADDPIPPVGDLPPDAVTPLVFETGPLSFPLPGMSDVMPYPSSRFATLSADQLAEYRAAWRHLVEQVVDEFQPDVIHSHHIWLLSGSLKDVTRDVPVVTHCHGTGLRQLQLCPHLADEVRRGCRRNEAFLVLHRQHAETLRRELDIAPEQIEIVGSGFREEVFHERGRMASPGNVITYAGKLSNAKGVPWLLDAVAALATTTPGVTLHLAGSGTGDEAEAIRARIAGLETAVLHGQLDQQQLANLFRHSAVFVLPSFFEGLPLVLVEAAACGCRLVATDIPGIREQLAPVLGEALQTVPLPRLRNIDQPVEEDLPGFVEHLVEALASSLRQPPVVSSGQLVSAMTWRAIFRRIERIWRGLVS